MQLEKASGSVDLSKKHLSSSNLNNLKNIIASIEDRRISATGSCTPGSSSDTRSRTEDSRESRTPSSQRPSLVRSGSSSDNSSVQTRTPEGSEQRLRPRRLSHWEPRPTGDSDANRAKLATAVERTQRAVSRTAEGNFSRNRGGGSDRGRGRLQGDKSKNRRSSSRSSSRSTTTSSNSSESTSSSSHRRSRSRSRSGDFRRRSRSRSASSNPRRSHGRSDGTKKIDRVVHRHEERRSRKRSESRELYVRPEDKNRGGDRSRLGYRSATRRNDRARPDDRYHREPSHGRGERYGKNARGSRSCEDRDSRERSFNRTSSRGGQSGRNGERKTKKQYEPSKSWNGRDADNSDRHTPNRGPPSLSRDNSYGKGERNRTSTSTSSVHGQNVREISRERRKSESRDHRGDDCNGSRNTEPRGIARNVDEHIVRARRMEGNQGSTPSRNDECRSVESCSSMSASLRDSSAGSARHPTTTCKVSSGGSGGNGSAVKSREVGDDPSPVVRSAISSAYDRIPMPTTSLEYTPSSIGVEDLFSLEDQFPDHVIRGAEATATPGQSGCRSSLGSTTSATAGAFVAACAMTAVSDSPAPASTAVTAAVASVTETSPPDPAPARSGPEQLIEDDEANGGKLVGPVSRGVSLPLSQAAAASERGGGGGGEKSGPEAGDLAITNERNMSAESMAAATGSSPRKGAGDTQVSTTMEPSRTAEATPPLLPMPMLPEEAAEIPSVSEITPASAVATGEAPRLERSTESSPTCARELEGESGTVVAATVAEDSGLSSMFSGGSLEAGCCSSGGRNTQRLAVAGAQEVAPTDAVGDTSREREARKDKTEADGDVEKDVGAMVDQGGTEREEEGKEEENGDRGRCDEGGEDVEQQEDEGSEKEGITSVGGVKRARKSYRWYRKGTLVVLNCGPDDKPGKPRPFVPIADLLGRPVSVDSRSSDCRTLPWYVLEGRGKERSQMYPMSM